MPVWMSQSTAVCVGLMGSDTAREAKLAGCYSLKFQGIALNGANLVIAGKPGTSLWQVDSVVTSYPALATRLLGELGLRCRVLPRVGGSVEIAPELIASVNGVVDVVKSGDTLRAQGLEPLRPLMQVQFGLGWMPSWNRSVPGSS